jgi:hypothetical protein
MSTRAEQIHLSSALNKHILKANDFYRDSQKDAAVDTDTITVNESSQMPETTKNPKRYPLSVYTSEDNKKSYKNHTFVTKPVLIEVENEALTSFNKRANESEKHGDQLIEDFAETIMYEWTAVLAAQQYRTTGGTTGATTGAMTGTRKAIIEADIFGVHRIMDNNGVPKNGRVAICDTLHFYELLAIARFSQHQLAGLVDPWIEGDLARRLGLKRLYVRDSVVWYDNTATPVKQEMISESTTGDKLEQNAPVAASNLSMMFWHPTYVRHSFGMSRMHVKNGGPEYNGGTLLNGTVRGGGMLTRIDGKGLVSLIQTVGA